MDENSQFLEVALKAAEAGGDELLRWLGRIEVREKAPFDLVTQADLAAQRVVRDVVLGEFPGHAFLGEEDDPADHSRGEGWYRWVVDPLDGTTNFIHGVPFFAVSVALQRGDELLVGVVFNPVSGECFNASAGQGAFLGDRPIHVSDVESMHGALAVVGFPAQTERDSPDLELFLKLVGRCQAIRRTGSAALNLCYVAAGRFDLFWSYSTKIWDMAAGALLIQEAGGEITDLDGGPLRLQTGKFLTAATKPLHAQLCQVAKIVGESG